MPIAWECGPLGTWVHPRETGDLVSDSARETCARMDEAAYPHWFGGRWHIWWQPELRQMHLYHSDLLNSSDETDLAAGQSLLGAGRSTDFAAAESGQSLVRESTSIDGTASFDFAGCTLARATAAFLPAMPSL